jgi:hypothetical protein
MNSMKRTTSLVLGLALSLSSLSAFAGEPAAKPPMEKAEKKPAAKPAAKAKAPKASTKKAAPAAGDQGSTPAN